MAVTLNPGVAFPPVATNGTSLVEVVPAPPADNFRTILSLVYVNLDTVAHVVLLVTTIDTTDYTVNRWSVDAGTSQALVSRDNIFGIDDFDGGNLQVQLEEATTTNEGTVTALWYDRQVV